MLKPRSLHLTVDTAERTYNVSWYSGMTARSDGDIGTADELSVTVETSQKDGCLLKESFHIPVHEITTKITGTKDLQDWFYNDFAYRYADLHQGDEETGCLRASILYELGNYEVVRGCDRIKAAKGLTKTIIGDRQQTKDNSPVFYVCMNEAGSPVYSFSSYDNAEQWANEKLYQEESINVGYNNLPYTIFTVKSTNEEGCKDKSTPQKQSDSGSEDDTKSNFLFNSFETSGLIYYLTEKDLKNIFKRKKD